MIVCVLALLLLTLDILAYSLNNLMLVSLHVPIINAFQFLQGGPSLVKGTNSFKGGSLPSEVIGPGGTKYFEEIGPGDQFLWGTIHFVTGQPVRPKLHRY